MAFEQRDYYRERGDGGGGGIGGFGRSLNMRSVVTWLLILNVAVAVWIGIFSGSQRGRWLDFYDLASFEVGSAIFGGQVWRLLTYQFLHAGFFHLLFNMIGLYFFGPLMERWWGSKRFLAFYLLCGATGAVIFTLIVLLAPGMLYDMTAVRAAGYSEYDSGLVGASGSLFGILAACAVVYPHQRVMLLFPPIPMTMRTMALVFLGIAAVSLIAGSRNAGGEAAHLGGALTGFLLVKYPRVLGFADRVSPQAVRDRLGATMRQRETRRSEDLDAEIDRILDKVSREGLQSLTHKEKKLLQRDTERKRRAG